jgi:hypothetical protein
MNEYKKTGKRKRCSKEKKRFSNIAIIINNSKRIRRKSASVVNNR